MAAQNSERGSKSRAVREYLSQHPDAGPNEIVTALKEKGITITVGLASNVKSVSKKRKKVRVVSRTPKSDTQAAASPRVSDGSSLSVNDLLEAKRFADMLGGVSNAQRALELLEQLG